MVPGLCVAQQSQQFVTINKVELTGGQVTSFATGSLQSPSGGTDFLYVGAPVGSGANTSVTVGELLNQSGSGFINLGENQITFPNVSKVVAALGDFDGDGKTDYAFALTTTAANKPNLCVYFGTGAQAPSIANPVGGGSSYNGGGVYPPVAAGKSFCATVPATSPAGNQPHFDYIANFPFKTSSSLGGVILVDSLNNMYYIVQITLGGIQVTTAAGLPAGLGAGPIYVGDLNGDGNNDFVIDGQTKYEAWVNTGDGTGKLLGPSTADTFDDGVHSMLLRDMDHDGILDMVVENAAGAIEIFHGNGNATFQATSEGGTAVGASALAGVGGHLAIIDPNTHNILTATPIGLSVLEPLSGTLTYGLKGIYNIGPGRTSFALADYFETNALDLAVDSAEGIAIFAPDSNGDGGFQTANAYSSLAPALGAVVGKFRNIANNPKGNVDVVVGTGAVQAQLLTGNGDGTFATYPGVVDSSSGPGDVPAAVWSNVLSGDFDGDGNLDLLYSLTGLPSPGPSANNFPILYIQYGNGNGTFGSSGFTWNLGAPSGSNLSALYSESATGDFNGDGVTDIASGDPDIEGDLLGANGSHGLNAGLIVATLGIPSFDQVAAGFFKVGRTSQQDIVFQQGANFSPYVNKQDGTGSHFTAMPAISGASAPYYASTVLLTDLDGDKNADLVVVYYNTAANPVGSTPAAPNQVDIWWGNGDGTFSAQPQVLSLSRNYYLGAVADMNADGLPDLVLSDGSLVSILYNQGNRSFGTVIPSTGLYTSEQHFLAGEGINSITLADVNGDGEPDLVVANGGATIANAIAIGGETQASISLTPNPDINTGGITVLLNAFTTEPVTGTLIAMPEPSSFGATFTITATLTPSPGVAPPTGSVQFYIDGTTLGLPVAVVQGTANSTASYVVPAGNTYAAGVHPLTAYYSGDSANSPLTFSDIPGTHLIVGGATTTQLFLCVGPTPACPSSGYVMPPFLANLTMYYGQTWNGTTTASANDGSALTGTIAVDDTYNGLALPTLCTLAVNQAATCPASVGVTGPGTGVGVNVITAVYSGDASHLSSTSPSVTITVLQDTNSATLTGSPNPSPAGQPVIFTATFTGNYAPPTGIVNFTFAGAPLGSANLTPSTNGVTSTATLTTSTLPVGSDVITVAYAATTDFAAASATFTETITPGLSGNFTLTVTPGTVSVGVGYGTLLAVTVTPQNGFSQGVNLTCGNLPTEVTCFFDNASIAAGGGTTDMIVQTTAPHTCGSNQPYFLGSNGSGPGVAPLAALAGLLAGFIFIPIPGKRRWLRTLLAVLAAAGLMQMTGCSTCTDLGTRPATYTVQVTGTSTGTSEVQSQPVTISVTI